jgi:hypothetical protein
MCFSWESVHGFPANSRLGYGNCGTCHHSPIGGGVLTDYGSSTASEISSFTIFKDKESKPSLLFAGGDVRLLYTHTEDKEAAFPMQADIELGGQYRGFKTVAQLGVYGKDYKLASYRAYIMYTYKKHSFRAGKFAPAFGINEPDHYLPGRNTLGFDNRSGSFNLEYQYSSKSYSLNATAIGGFQGAIFKQDQETYFDDYGRMGVSLHGSIFPITGLLLSTSGVVLYDPEEEAYQTLGALSWVIGEEEIYSKLEYAVELTEDLRLEGQGYTDLMFVPVKGIHTGVNFRRRKQSFSYGSSLLWYPVKGLEIQTSLERTISKFNDSSKFLGLVHFYF